MCDVTAVAIAGLALTAASTVAGAYSSYQQQQSQNKANAYNAAMLQRNAKIAEMQAQQVEAQGKVDEAKHRQQVQALVGAQRAGFSSNGLLVDTGTPMDVTSDTVGFGELDTQALRANTAREAWALRNQSADYTAQSNLSLMRSSSPLLAAGGSLLTGASKLATDVYSYRKVFG